MYAFFLVWAHVIHADTSSHENIQDMYKLCEQTNQKMDEVIAGLEESQREREQEQAQLGQEPMDNFIFPQ